MEIKAPTKLPALKLKILKMIFYAETSASPEMLKIFLTPFSA
jgi:hypothetical protein